MDTTSKNKSSTTFYIILITLLILLIFAFVLSIIALVGIRGNGNFSTDTNLQTAYDFGIGFLILILFALIFLIISLVIFVRNKRQKSGLFVGFLIFVNLLIFGTLILGGIVAQKSKNVSAIFSLIFLIICFILNIILYFFLGRLSNKQKIQPESVSKTETKKEPSTVIDSISAEL